MAFNNQQQQQFWDFVQGLNNNGAGVDHPAEGSFPFGHPGPSGTHPQPPYPPPPPHHPGFGGPFGFGFGGPGFGGPGFGGPGFGGLGCGGPGHRGGRRCRRGRCQHRESSHERTPSGDAAHEHSENEAREGSPHEGQHDEEDAPHRSGRHGPGRHGRHGRRGGWGGPRHNNRGPPPFPGAPAFDLSALLGSLSAHPLAQAFRNFTEGAGQQSGETGATEDAENTFTPPIDVFTTPSAYILHVAIPGAKKEDVGVNWDAEKGALNVAGVVYRKGDEEFLKMLSQSERKVGVFERTIKLPPGDAEKEEVDGDMITAKLEDGVLVVTVPKVEKEKEWTEVKRVDIQ